MDDVQWLLARVWKRLSGRVQWRLMWLRNATFMVGVTGVVRDAQGRVLLLRHRYWPEGREWGFPGGYAVRGETFEGTVEREVREETGLEVEVTRLIHVRSGYRLRIEVAYEAVPVGGTLRPDGTEILEARWFDPARLPERMQPSHRAFIR